MSDKFEYERQLKFAESQRYNPEELIKPQNIRVLFEIISEAKKQKQLKEKLNKIEEYCINQELTAVFGGSILEGKLAGISVAKNKILEIIKEEEQ